MKSVFVPTAAVVYALELRVAREPALFDAHFGEVEEHETLGDHLVPA